jgi:hypothetical protein
MTDRWRTMWRRAEQAAVLGIGVAFFGFVGKLRVVDDDEGFYALAGRALFSEGLVPYRDYFLPQLPVSPLLYGLVQAVAGVGLVPLRWSCAVLAAVATTLVFAMARRGGGPAAVYAVGLFAAHVLVWEWAPTVKTFSVSLPLLLGALALAGPGASPRRFALAGFLAGLASGTRLLAAPAIVGVVTAAWQARAETGSRSPLVVSLGGFLFGLLPIAAVASTAPDAFWFDNVTYHALRSGGEGLVEDLPQKLETLRALLLPPLGATRADVTGLQTVLLVALGAFAVWRERVRSIPLAVTAATLAVVALLPSPAWTQYFTLVIGPLSVLGAHALARLSTKYASVIAVLYVACAATTFNDRILVQPEFARPAAFDDVGRVLDALTHEGDRVAAHWPAYLAGSNRDPLPEARNQFARLYSHRVSPSERRRFGLYTESEFRDALLARRAQAFVVGTFVEPKTALALRDAGWKRASDLPGATIWVVPERAP